MYYRIRNGKLYDFAQYQYAPDCQETDIITEKELLQDPAQVIVEAYEEEIPQEEGEPIFVTKYRLALNPDYVDIELEKAKAAKIAENDKLRDTAINAGVTYQDILFDSDTDQKVNLLATIQEMSSTSKMIWFGMNNDYLECSKADLKAIGALITELHGFCWTRNAEIKAAIAAAQTVDEVNAIEIDYNAE